MTKKEQTNRINQWVQDRKNKKEENKHWKFFDPFINIGFNPLWEKAKNLDKNVVDNMADALNETDDYIVLRVRQYIHHDQLGGYEAYYSKTPNVYYESRGNQDCVERVRLHLVQKGYDIEWVNGLEVIQK